MRADDGSREDPIPLTLGEDEDERERVHKNWRTFDAAACQCFMEQDKTRMLAVIERHPGGVHGFNASVKHMAADLLGHVRISHSHASSASSSFVLETAKLGPGLTNVLPGSASS